jgi:hypothetical protein
MKRFGIIRLQKRHGETAALLILGGTLALVAC